jgi:hypothetical protein
VNEPDNPLDALAARLSDDRFFLASALADYQRRHGLDDAALARELGCDPAALTLLRLCRRPGAAEPGRPTEQDVTDISERFGIDAAALRRGRRRDVTRGPDAERGRAGVTNPGPRRIEDFAALNMQCDYGFCSR